MTVKEQLDLIKQAQQNIAELNLEQKKIYEEVLEKVEPNPRLESFLWDFVYNGVQCYKYDIESLLKNRKNWLDSEDQD